MVCNKVSNILLICIFAVTTMLQGFREDDETMKHLHFLLYNTTGKQGSRKRTIRNFSGYATEAQSKDALRRLVENKKRWTLAVLKDICGVLGLEKNGTREEVAKRVADFCSSPHTTKSASSSIKVIFAPLSILLRTIRSTPKNAKAQLMVPKQRKANVLQVLTLFFVRPITVLSKRRILKHLSRISAASSARCGPQ